MRTDSHKKNLNKDIDDINQCFYQFANKNSFINIATTKRALKALGYFLTRQEIRKYTIESNIALEGFIYIVRSAEKDQCFSRDNLSISLETPREKITISRMDTSCEESFAKDTKPSKSSVSTALLRHLFTDANGNQALSEDELEDLVTQLK